MSLFPVPAHSKITSARSLFRKLFFPIALLFVSPGCDHREAQKEQTQTAPPALTAAFGYSCALSPRDGVLAVLNQAKVAEEKDGWLIQATGPDAQLGFRVTAEGRHAVSLDITSPGDTVLELFYQVRNLYQDPAHPFSAQHVLKTPLKTGRNRVLLLIDDPRFSGGLRLDPGQIPGAYALHSLQVFSNAAVSFMPQATPQGDLAASFDQSTKILFSAKSSGGWGMIKGLHDAQLVTNEEGLSVNATGTDPQLELPEFDLNGNPIVKIVIVSPSATVLQIFSRTKGRLDYYEGRSARQPLEPGENTIYLQVPVRDAAGTLRLDPGAVAGNYLLKDLEIRASAETRQ